MHQRLEFVRDETIVDEKIFFDAEFYIATLQIACAVVANAMPQDQVLRPRWCANRVGLHESQVVERAFQRRRLEQRACNGEPPQIVNGDRHDQILPKGTESNSTHDFSGKCEGLRTDLSLSGIGAEEIAHQELQKCQSTSKPAATPP